MRTFADDENDIVYGFPGEAGKKPAEQGSDDAGGMLERGGIARRGKDEHHPDNDRHPVDDEGTSFLHAA